MTATHLLKQTSWWDLVRTYHTYSTASTPKWCIRRCLLNRRFKAICYVRCPSRLCIHLRIIQYSYHQRGSALHSSGVVMESNPCLSWAVYVYVQSSFLVQLVVGEAAITCYSPKSATSRPWFKKVCHRKSGVRRSKKGAVFSSSLFNHAIRVWDGTGLWV